MRIDGISQAQLNISNISDILSKLNVGDVVRTQVIDIMSNELILKLFDGTTMNASSMSQLDVKRGDFVDFTVKSKNDNQLFLETVKNSKFADADGELKKQLISLNIKPDELSVNIAKELKNQNITINKDIIDKAVEGVLKFKGLTPEKAVFLAANNLEPGENQISKLNSLIESKLKVSSDIKELMSQLEAIDDVDVLQSIQKHMAGTTEAVTTKTADFQKETTIYDNKYKEKAAVEKQIHDIVKEINNSIVKGALNNKQPVDTAKLEQLLNSVLKTNNGLEKDVSPEKLVQNLKDALKSEGINIEKLPFTTQKDLNALFNNAILKQRQLDTLNSAISDYEKMQSNKAKENISKQLESTFVKIDENLSGQDIDAKKVYNDMLSKLQSLKESIQHAGNNPAVRDMLARIDNMEGNIRFMNDINNYSSYVQIPLNINNNSTTGELYILRRDSKRKKIDPENATMYISLNTEHMGQVDSLITITKKNVSVNMRVEEQLVIDFLKENHKELYNRLQDKGYKLVDFKYRLLEGQANAVNINSVVKKEIESSRQSIDFRI